MSLDLDFIRSQLCTYDERNPDNTRDVYDADDMPAVAAAACGCDNCFYGRTRLASALLEVSA